MHIHSKFIHHKRHLKPLSQLHSTYSGEGIFQHLFQCKKVHTILVKYSTRIFITLDTDGMHRHIQVLAKYCFYRVDSKTLFHHCVQDSSFFLLFKNGPSKLEFYTTLGWKGSPGSNTPAYWAICKKWKNKVMRIRGDVFATLCFLRNLRIGPIG
jgi:hypothetical protein